MKVLPSNSPDLHSHCNPFAQPPLPDLCLKQLQVLSFSVCRTRSIIVCRNLAVPWTLLNITKLVLSLTLVLLPISDLLYLVYVYQGGGVVAQVHIVANILRAATYLLALLLMLNCKRKGEVTSGTLFIYWLVATACGAVTFR